MQICAIDNGYFNTKVKTEKQLFKFRSKIQEFNEEQFGADTIDVFGKTYIIGNGKDTIEIKKIDNEVHRICTIAGLSMATNEIEEFKVITALPMIHYLNRDFRNQFKNYLITPNIIHRASILLNDYSMEMLLSIPPNDEIDFTKWANEGKCIIIKMSDLAFNRDALQALVTFIYSKIWLAMLARGRQDKPRLTHVILDEIHNFPQVCDMLKNTCREAAKFGLSYVFTSHSLLDLKGLLPYIKASGSNFMLFKTTKENIKLLQEELELGGFDLEQCLKVKDYHTVNIVNYDRDYIVYTSKVVDPINKRYIKHDRRYLDTEHSNKYGFEIKDAY